MTTRKAAAALPVLAPDTGMKLVDYLFIDAKRLQSYVEQIGSPTTYDSVPTWSAQVSLTGIEAGGSTNRHPRPLTYPEQILVLVKHLKSQKLLDCPIAGQAFALEEILATKVHVPLSCLEAGSASGLVMWVSTPEMPKHPRGGPRLLCLLEDFPFSDVPPNSLARWRSGFSLLTMLIEHLQIDLHKSLLSDCPSHLGRDSMEYRMLRAGSVQREMESFAIDPFETLHRLGCQSNGPRLIESLYRIRQDGPDDSMPSHVRSIFAYPIYISSST